jgi:hypothetical protein
LNFFNLKPMAAPDKKADLLRTKLNLETAQMPWQELQRFFAAGKVILVSDQLDLVDVAASISNDDTARVSQWLSEQRIARVTDAQAAAWLEADAALWTVVVSPWILVQQEKPA